MRSSRWSTDESGYATVAAAGVTAAVIALLSLIAWQAGALVAREQAQVAADLSAVAGAHALAAGAGDPEVCALAAETAGHNGAQLTACTVLAGDLITATRVRGQEAQARAGPI